MQNELLNKYGLTLESTVEEVKTATDKAMVDLNVFDLVKLVNIFNKMDVKEINPLLQQEQPKSELELCASYIEFFYITKQFIGCLNDNMIESSEQYIHYSKDPSQHNQVQHYFYTIGLLFDKELATCTDEYMESKLAYGINSCEDIVSRLSELSELPVLPILKSYVEQLIHLVSDTFGCPRDTDFLHTDQLLELLY